MLARTNMDSPAIWIREWRLGSQRSWTGAFDTADLGRSVPIHSQSLHVDIDGDYSDLVFTWPATDEVGCCISRLKPIVVNDNSWNKTLRPRVDLHPIAPCMEELLICDTEGYFYRGVGWLSMWTIRAGSRKSFLSKRFMAFVPTEIWSLSTILFFRPSTSSRALNSFLLHARLTARSTFSTWYRSRHRL